MKSNNSYRKNSTENIQGGTKMRSYLIMSLTILVTGLFAGFTEPSTGWEYEQSVMQAFYMLEELTIDGDIAEGDGAGAPPNDGGDCSTSGSCDVVGAFVDRDGTESCGCSCYRGFTGQYCDKGTQCAGQGTGTGIGLRPAVCRQTETAPALRTTFRLGTLAAWDIGRSRDRLSTRDIRST